MRRTLVTVSVALAFAMVALEAGAQVPWRYSLRDGSVVTGSPIAEDQSTVTIRTTIGVLRVLRTDILSAQPATASSPPPAPPMIVSPMPSLVYLPAPAPARRSAWRGLTVGGGVLLGLLWTGTSIGAGIMQTLGDRNAWMGFVPVFGPVMWALPYASDKAAITLAILDTVFQGIGAAMLLVGVIGWSTSRAISARTAPPRFALVPVPASNGASLVATGWF